MLALAVGRVGRPLAVEHMGAWPRRRLLCATVPQKKTPVELAEVRSRTLFRGIGRTIISCGRSTLGEARASPSDLIFRAFVVWLGNNKEIVSRKWLVYTPIYAVLLAVIYILEKKGEFIIHTR